MPPNNDEWEALRADVTEIKEALLGQVDSDKPGLSERVRAVEKTLATWVKVGAGVVLALLAKVVSDIFGFPVKFQ